MRTVLLIAAAVLVSGCQSSPEMQRVGYAMMLASQSQPQYQRQPVCYTNPGIGGAYVTNCY